ncbi:MAG: hypothetical protein ACXADB_05675 [Candidatus Hermodarchaeia archaeon]|jgi:hypothetical protein
MIQKYWPLRIQVVYNATTDQWEKYLVTNEHGMIGQKMDGEISDYYYDSRSFAQWPASILVHPDIPKVVKRVEELDLGNFTCLSIKDGVIDSFYWFGPKNFQHPAVEYDPMAWEKSYRCEHKFNVNDDRSFVYYHLADTGDNIPWDTIPEQEATNLAHVLEELPRGIYCRIYTPKDRGHCFCFSRSGGWTERRTL